MSFDETPQEAWEFRLLPQIETRSGALWWQVREAFEAYLERCPSEALSLAERVLARTVENPAAWLNVALRSTPEGAKLTGPPSTLEDPP